MKHSRSILVALMSAMMIVNGCQESTPRAGHVIVLGFDAMSALGIQRAHTPNFNKLIENGAVSVHTRCIRETSSSQNWTTMVTGAPVEMHSVIDNRWQPGPNPIVPSLTNAEGKFPTMFDAIRAQKPQYRQYAFIEWGAETRLYDMNAFDKVSVYKTDPDLKEPQDVMRKAFSTYMEERPELLFVSMDLPDHMGHTFGHESDEYLSCITEMDSFVGEFVDQLEAKGWMDDTVILICADHGGIGFGHGGDSMAEFEIPVILYGKGVTKGKLMERTNMIYDIAATVTGLLGVELPWEARGKFLTEAFEPKTEASYVPLPFLRPFKGNASDGITVSVDDPDAKVYYTLDGSTPDENSTLYTGKFSIDSPCTVKSRAYKNGSWSSVAENTLYPDGNEAPVAYKLYLNVPDKVMPDFTKFGKPSSEGYVNMFGLDEFPIDKEDHFALLLTSNFIAEEDGEYRFYVSADDAARIYIDGDLVAVNSNAHSGSGIRQLTKGRHIMKVEYFEFTGTQFLTVSYSLNREPYKALLPAQLSR